MPNNRRRSTRWSLRLVRIGGIDVRVHATFALLLLWVASVLVARGAVAARAFFVTLLALFACVVLHELGHALTGRLFGIRTRMITLLPIGGVARLDRNADRPYQELLISLAGPLVSVALALSFYGIARWMSIPFPATLDVTASGPLLWKLAWLNASLAVFNLLPAFPMDGGRALRALLAMRLGRLRATAIAARIGQLLALLFMAVGAFGSPMLLLIGGFVFIAAQSELASVNLDTLLAEVRAKSAMITEFVVVAAHEPLELVVDMAAHGFQSEFPLLEDGRFVGTVSQAQLARAVIERGPGTRVGEIEYGPLVVVGPEDRLDGVLAKMHAEETSVALVMDHDELLGVLTLEKLAELVALRAALRDHRPKLRPVTT
jgi:Zn-dependent protease